MTMMSANKDISASTLNGLGDVPVGPGSPTESGYRLRGHCLYDEAQEPTNPFQCHVNPHLTTALAHSRAWIERFQLFASERARGELAASNIPHLGALAYPFCPLDELQIACDWCIWLFAWDDKCDRTLIGKDPNEVRRMQDDYLQILKGASLGPSASPLMIALADLRDRMLAACNARWFDRFTSSVQDYFAGCVWEAENRKHEIVPTPETYMTMRQWSGAVYTVFNLFELTDRVVLPDHVRDEAIFKSLERSANNIICWANDIFSLQRELGNGDAHNLIIVIMCHNGLSLRDALSLGAQMHNDEVQSYMNAELSLPSYGAEIDIMLERHCRLMKAWMAANHHWSLTTRRYGVMNASANISLFVP